MNYLKYTQYVYLIAAIIFAVKAIEMWNQEREKSYLFFAITAVAIFIFFFRRKFSKKFEDRNNKS